MGNDERIKLVEIENGLHEEPVSPDPKILTPLFTMVSALYRELTDTIPQEEESAYVLGNNFLEALDNSTTAISELSEDLEPYCAALSLACSCRVFRISCNPDDTDPNLYWDWDRNRKILDITQPMSLVQGKIEEIENLEHRSARQTAILQISYLILAEAELSSADLDAQALDYFAEACKLPPIQFYPKSLYTFDQKLRMLCLRTCGQVENVPKTTFGWDYVWDLSDRECLRFWAGLNKTEAISYTEAIMGNVPDLLMSEVIALEHQYPVAQDYFIGESNSLNDSLKELLEITEQFRNNASEIDILDSDEPCNSNPEGSAYWCWKLGRLVGAAAKFAGPAGIENILSDRSWFNGSSSTHMTLDWHMFSLFVECIEARDWARYKKVCMQAWFSLLQDKYSDIDEITPSTRSYWAMRTGICDSYLDSSIAAQDTETLVLSGAVVGSVDQEIVRQIVDQLTTNLASTVIDERVQLSAELQEIKSRLPASSNQIKDFIDKCLGDVLTEYNLPRVRSHLIKAERYYRTEVDVDESKVSFAKSVEGTLRFAFVKGFMQFIKERGNQSVDIVFAGKRGVEIASTDKINKFSLGEWSDAFTALNSTSPIKTMARNSLLGQYLATYFDEKPVQILDEVTFDLGRVQSLRNSASHFHEDGRPDEADRLEELRELALGIKCKSVIENIVESFQLVYERK